MEAALATKKSDGVELRITYPGVHDVPILYANQFVLQLHMDEFILTAAQFAPPILVGTVDQKRAQASSLDGELPVKVIARLAMNKRQLTTLIDLLQKHVQISEGSEVEPETEMLKEAQ